MGRFVVNDRISIELFNFDDFKHLDSKLDSAIPTMLNLERNHVLYRPQFDSTSFVLGEREQSLEIIFKLNSSNFLFDLLGKSYQVHILYKFEFFQRFSNSVNDHIESKNGSNIPKTLQENYYKPLILSCESQSVLHQMVLCCENQLEKGIWNLSFKDMVNLESLSIRLLMDAMHVTERLVPICSDCSFLVNSDSSNKIMEAMNYIQGNFKENITIPQIAKAVGINQCYLKKGFKEIYGKTIYSMVQSLRMEVALSLLKTSEMNVLEIGLEVGYTNQASFSTAFKQYYGYSPQQVKLEI
jgi:AraC-like DNA-binding protein